MHVFAAYGKRTLSSAIGKPQMTIKASLFISYIFISQAGNDSPYKSPGTQVRPVSSLMGYAARYFAERKHTDYFAWASFKLLKFMIVNRCEVAHRSTPLWELSIRWTISTEYRWVYGPASIIKIGGPPLTSLRPSIMLRPNWGVSSCKLM